MSKVVVVANDHGDVVQQSENNSEFGHIRVEQVRTVIDQRGWVNRKKYIALIAGKTEDLEALDYSNGQKLDGKIIVKESLTPFNSKNPERDIKYADNSGVICMQNDQPIYRKCIYTLVSNAQDEYVQHTNVAEIKKAFNSTPVNTVVEEDNDDFSL